MNLLSAPLLTTLDPTERIRTRMTLTGALAALARGEVGDFPRLRPHQRHVWHALLVQIAALAMVKGDLATPPEDEAVWRDLLLALTPDDPDGAAWALVSPAERPAFLQAPVTGGDLTGFKTVATPDELDMLVMSKNHDLKSGTLPADDAELWLYALVSLQTQEGFLGAGNYGIARMNGGFASRPALSIAREGTASTQFLDDCQRALQKRADLSRSFGYRSAGALALTWLAPWDGTQSLPLETLDLFFVDICRRVRLVATDGGLSARVTSSKAARIEAKAAKGNTGDLWTPTLSDKDETKAFTADARGWSYQQLVRLLFPVATNKGETVAPSPLMEPAEITPTDGLSVIGRVFVRGQGKTEGYHERHVPVSGLVRAGFGRRRAAAPLAAMAHARVKDAGTMVRQVLFPTMMAIFAGAPRTDAGERARDDDTTKSRAGKAAARFDTLIDADFFSDLALEAEVIDDAAASEAVRARWILDRLHRAGRAVLMDAIAAAPDAAARHWRVRVQAVDVFSACFNKQFGDRLRAAGLFPPTVDASERSDDAVTTENADV